MTEISNGAQARKALGLLTEDETADLLNLGSVSTLATWRGQRRGPDYVKLGKTVFYTMPLIQRWIDESYTEQRASRLGRAGEAKEAA